MKVELFESRGCQRCAAARDALRQAAEAAVPGLTWRDVDAGNELDLAVEVGVMILPAVAIDGQLVFSSLPSPAQLVQELRRRAQAISHGR